MTREPSTTLPCLLSILIVGGLTVLPCPSPLSAQTIQGRLLDAETDRPINVGLVIMLTEARDSISSTITNENGYFSLTSQEPGSFILLASAWGYRETPAGVFDLGADGEMTVEFRVQPQPFALDELVVSLNRPVLEHQLVRNGFVRRLQRGLGHFITPHDIEESPARSTESLFQGLQGVTVRPAQRTNGDGSGPLSYLGDQVMLQGTGRWCEPTIYIDGMRWRYDVVGGITLSSIAPLETISAIEVYRRPAEVPLEYGATEETGLDKLPSGGGGACGVVVIWTRQR